MTNFTYEDRVRVYSDDIKIPTREDILDKYKGQEILSCYNAIQNFSMNAMKDHYKWMVLYSFFDLGDIGNYDGCMEYSEHTRWNIINVNLTHLPVDVRFGL